MVQNGSRGTVISVSKIYTARKFRKKFLTPFDTFVTVKCHKK